jgi:hypothetical protein
VAAAAVAIGLATASGWSAGAATTTVSKAAQPTTSTVAKDQHRHHRHRHFSMRQTWAREATRYGDADTSVYHIEHVRELQYRLTWTGALHTPITGRFGKATRKGVVRYQRREGLPVTRRAGHLTWAHLIRDTIRGRARVPHFCKSAGWHACYDRHAHQVMLFHDGDPRNSWLVRGGDYDSQTRVGTHTVYLRDIDHVSRLYDAPMPYAQFFDGGEALHGSAYMIDPFVEHSHGCINMYIEDARQLWNLTSDKRLTVTVYGPWD